MRQCDFCGGSHGYAAEGDFNVRHTIYLCMPCRQNGITVGDAAERNLMSTREEAQALAQRIAADGYGRAMLDSMVIGDPFAIEELQRRMWHVLIWYGNSGRSFLSAREYEAWSSTHPAPSAKGVN